MIGMEKKVPHSMATHWTDMANIVALGGFYFYNIRP
ncbi:hypothetical protein M002_01370 [Pseudomonas aeruginosa ID4365]|nr:hypothetical protein M002_01370 [Pseudomonas aeruginosa ID4365]